MGKSKNIVSIKSKAKKALFILIACAFLILPDADASVIVQDNFTPILGKTRIIYVYDNVLWSSTSGGSLIKSIDQGKMWTTVYAPGVTVGSILMVSSSGTIFFSYDVNGVNADPPGVWYRSTDNGQTFEDVLTYANGGQASWSFDLSGNKFLVGEYGEYPSCNVYQSTGGATTTWTTIFTHPNCGGSTPHVHKVSYDPYDANNIFVSYGDSSERGVSWSNNGGSSFSSISSSYQPTWIVPITDWVIWMGDNIGQIHRTARSDLGVGNTFNLVFNGDTYMNGRYEDISYYAGSKDNNGILWAGGIHYGYDEEIDDTYGGNLLKSIDDGATWELVREWQADPTGSVGVNFISQPTDDNKLLIQVPSDSAVYLFDANQPKSNIGVAGAWKITPDPL